VIDLSRGCTRFRPVLIDFVDRGEVRPETGDALAHLDRCTRCTEIVESTMLTITALRRMGDEAATAEPQADAWPRLRVRIQGWHRRPVTMSPLAGIAMSFAIVAVLVLPLGSGESLLGPVATPASEAGPGATVVDRRIEDAYLASLRQRALPGDVSLASGWLGDDPRPDPDEVRPTWKEVSPAEPTGKPPRAI
jgi:hypothetical protein